MGKMIAIVAAITFGLSLLALNLPKMHPEGHEEEEHQSSAYSIVEVIEFDA